MPEQELKILLILLDYTLNGAKISKFTNTYGIDYTVDAAINSNSNYPLRPFLTCFQFYSIQFYLIRVRVYHHLDVKQIMDGSNGFKNDKRRDLWTITLRTNENLQAGVEVRKKCDKVFALHK